MAKPTETAAADMAAVKDRSDRTAWLAVLEAIAVVLLREKIASMANDAERGALAAALKSEVDTVCAEIAALAPTSGYRGTLSPAAAKAAAARIKGGADYLVQEYLLALLPPTPHAQPAAPAPAPAMP